MSTAGKLSDFCVEEVLGGDAAAKTAVLLGRIKGTAGGEDRAIVLLERLPFATETAEVTSLLRGLSEVLTVEQNDIYRWLQASSGSTRDLKATLIFPATETVGAYQIRWKRPLTWTVRDSTFASTQPRSAV
jgi:hypothetical protein